MGDIILIFSDRHAAWGGGEKLLIIPARLRIFGASKAEIYRSPAQIMLVRHFDARLTIFQQEMTVIAKNASLHF